MPRSGDRSGTITVMTARREWSTSQKRRIVDEATAPGAQGSLVARRNYVAAGLVYRWRKEMASFAQPAPKFVPVAIAPPAPEAPVGAGPIEIMLTNGRVVRVSSYVDTAALVRIVAALEKPE